MFAVDTSTLIAFFNGDTGKDVAIFIEALENRAVLIPPPVITEILSDPILPDTTRKILQRIPKLLIEVGFWERAASSRSKVLAKRKKARLADTLIAQCCIDNGAELITRDSDFKNFTRFCGLNVVGL